MCASWRKSSIKQYSVYLKKWTVFCADNRVDVRAPSEVQIVDFLTSLFQRGESYSAINTARSALSSFIINEQGLTAGNTRLVKRFLKGVFELRPPQPRYEYIWDANIVLDFLKNFCVEDISLVCLTKKLVTLMALASAQRVQTLSYINIDNICYQNDFVLIHVFDLLKQSNINRRKFTMRFERNENPLICVYAHLEEFLKRTSLLRGSHKKLFISYQKPHGEVSRSTLSRWIKDVLYEAGINIETFKAHSTRAAASSRARQDNVNVDDILKTAGWSSRHTFRKYYDKVILDAA